MIICSCNVLSDAEVRTVMSGSTPPRTPCQVYCQLGCRAQCGRCAITIRRIMQDTESPEDRCTGQASSKAA